MAGGLLQLSVYGSQDLFLTGTPQITFFKIVYRRYTNFAVESIPQDFLGESDFNFETSCVIEKIGDLMGKIYLEVELPEINLLKNRAYYIASIESALIEYTTIKQYYQMVYNYINIDSDVIRKLLLLCKTNNISMIDIEATMNSELFTGKLVDERIHLETYILESENFNNILALRDFKLDLIYQIKRIDIKILFNSIIANINKLGRGNSAETNDFLKRKDVIFIINNGLYAEIKDFYMSAYDLYIKYQRIYEALINKTYQERYKCAWVEQIGNALIDTLDIRIGSQLFDRHTGDWYITFMEIIMEQYQLYNYNKLIGNVPELYTFDDKIKPSYRLMIPLQFWFCRHNGLCLPLVALRYHDVMFTLRIKDLAKLFYIQDDSTLLDIQNIQSQYNIHLRDLRLWVDYVFLDSDERRRFAQSTHEYLIEIVQFEEHHGILGRQYNANLVFAHPTKFLIWYVQPNQYRHNPTGRNKCQWNNFGTRPDKTGYPLRSESIRLNTYNITDPTNDIKFFNFVQPYEYFKHSPTDGLNVYSFSTIPMEHQPSATCNFSRIDDLSINLIFTDEFLNLINNNVVNGVESGIFFVCYVLSYDIMRIMSGMAGLAFQTST
uniref:Major capsid protein N-terminal domain-containing protein n=1 Tax=viral metagenome TaxID=1070528 RepID=A0A6C0LRW2_9ZZZZ